MIEKKTAFKDQLKKARDKSWKDFVEKDLAEDP